MAYITDTGSQNVLAKLGNEPGPHAGDLVVLLPGGSQLTAASESVILTPEGVYGADKTGRQFFVSNGGLALVDAPAEQVQPPSPIE